MDIFNHKIIGVCILISLVYACLSKDNSKTIVAADEFKVVVPFVYDGRQIIIQSRWGQTNYSLQFDNHSPTWLDPLSIKNNPAISVADEYGYRTSTADGRKITGDVFICDTVLLGNLKFSHVFCYSIDKKKSKLNGVFGENLISKGIWKISFKDSQIIFASHLDSIGSLDSAKKLPATFTDYRIEIDISFSNGKKKRMAVDLGFNWGVLLPESDFAEISSNGIHMYEDSLSFSTPGGSETVLSKEAMAKIQVDGESYITQISSNPRVTEKLLGLLFFHQFEFIILDYINHDVYVSSGRLNG